MENAINFCEKKVIILECILTPKNYCGKPNVKKLINLSSDNRLQ